MNYQRPSLLLAAALSLATLPCLLSFSIHAQTTPEQPTATISGRVMLSGKPARGIKVSLVPGPYGSPSTPGRQSVRTDDEGNYEFKGLAAGRYGILAASYSYVSDDLFTLPIKPFKLCTVAAGDKLTGQNIRLVRGGVITGRVTDAEGRPVIVESVQLTHVDAQGKRQNFSSPVNDEMWQTDDRGVYRLFGLPPGRYLLSTGKEPGRSSIGSTRGFYRRLYYPGVAEVERAEVIELRESSEATGIDLRLGLLEKTFAASGRVIDAVSGQAVPGGWTDFYLFDNQTNNLRPLSFGNSANERGEFYYTGLPPGRYGIGGTADPIHNYYGGGITFEIKDGDVEELEIKLQRGATISGVVVLEGVLNAASLLQNTRLWLRPTLLNPSDSFSSDLPIAQLQADGSFQLKGLRPGKLRLELPGAAALKLSIQRIERNGVTVQEAFDLKPGEDVTGVRIVLVQATGSLRGSVVLPGLLSADWVPEVTLQRTDGGAQAEQTIQLDASNNFLLTALAIGEYEIVVTLNGKTANNSQPPEPLRRRVTVREGATTEVQLQIEPRR